MSIKYGPGDNTVNTGLDENYHDGEDGNDRLILNAGNAKSGLYFGLVTGVQMDTYFKHDGMQKRYYEDSKPEAKEPYHLADIAKVFEIHYEGFSDHSYLFKTEKSKGGKEFIRYSDFEEVDIYGTKYHDFIPYLNGREYHGGEGTDVFYADWRNWTSDIRWINNGEAVTFTPTLATGTAPAVTISGMEKLYLHLGSGNDHIELNNGYGEVHGGAGNDHLVAEFGGILYGGEGNDTFGNSDVLWSYRPGVSIRAAGGPGNDTYYVNQQVTIEEMPNEGTDTVIIGAPYQNFALVGEYANIENLTSHAREPGGALQGNALDNRIESIYVGAEMLGYEGNDTYIVRHADDKVVEYFEDRHGIDEVKTHLSVYTLPDSVERLDSYNNEESNILTGNSLDNYIRGYDQNDKLYGKAGNDELIGLDGDDELYGGEGNDILNGGTGADRLEGDTGDDRYYVDDAGDKVIEKANEGRDTVFSTIDYDLSKADNIHIENAVLQGTGNLTLQGNNEANLLKGNAGNNHLKGLAGNDWLEGGEGDDILNGNAGADRMIGGTGNDVYYVDNRGDVVVEEANGGRDTVNVFFDYDLMKVTHIENAILIGTANAGLQGNNEANLLKGNAGNNHLKGLAGNDWLEGGAGDDILNGNAGADRMIGGTGNDVYYVDNRGDVVVEEANGGRDTVNVFFDYDLMKVAHIENAALIGTANAGLQGNNGANLLKGNAGNNQLKGLGGNDWLDGGAGNDVLIGGSGKDTLVGGAGKDTFKFVDMADSTLSLRDVITDFKRGEDKIDLSVIDANTTQSGNQAFSFIGAAGFSAAGQVRFAGGVVYGDVNGDKVADFAIELKNVTTLQAGDFIL